MALAETDELTEAHALDGTDGALGVSVQVETARWEADRGDAGRAQKLTMVFPVERLTLPGTGNPPGIG
jgi:hypothetical protein